MLMQCLARTNEEDVLTGCSIVFYFILFHICVCVSFFIEFFVATVRLVWVCCLNICVNISCAFWFVCCGYFRFGIRWQWFMAKQSSQNFVYIFCVSLLVLVRIQECGHALMVKMAPYKKTHTHTTNNTNIYCTKTQVNGKQQTQSNSKPQLLYLVHKIHHRIIVKL